MSPDYPFREEPVRCPTCGRDAVLIVRTDGKQSALLDFDAEGLRCRYCKEREEARLQAVGEIRFPGPGPRSPINELARDLVRQIEHVAANAADPTLDPAARAAALAMLEGAFPVRLPKIRAMKAAAAGRRAGAKKSRATMGPTREAKDKQLRSSIRRCEVDEDGKRRGEREIKRILNDLGIKLSRTKIRELRSKR